MIRTLLTIAFSLSSKRCCLILHETQHCYPWIPLLDLSLPLSASRALMLSRRILLANLRTPIWNLREKRSGSLSFQSFGLQIMPWEVWNGWKMLQQRTGGVVGKSYLVWIRKIEWTDNVNDWLKLIVVYSENNPETIILWPLTSIFKDLQHWKHKKRGGGQTAMRQLRDTRLGFGF